MEQNSQKNSQSEFAESYADVPNNECSFRESLSDANTDTEADNLKTERSSQLDPSLGPLGPIIGTKFTSFFDLRQRKIALSN